MPHHNWRGFVVAVSTTAAFCLTAGVGSATASTRNDDARPADRPVTGLLDTPAEAGGEGQGTPRFAGSGSCTGVPAAVRATLRTAVTECVTVRTPEAARNDTRAAASGAGITTLAAEAAAAEDDPDEYDPGVYDPDPGDPPASATCTITQGVYEWTRTGGLCGKVQVTYTLYDTNGKSVGTGLINVSTSLRTHVADTDLSEDIRAEVVQVTGQVTALNIRFRTDCTSGCLATLRTPWYGNTELTTGQSKSGTVTYKGSIPASATRASFQTKYQMYVTTAGATPVDPSASWSPPADAVIRCDSEMPTTSGCVIPFTDDEDAPILEYSLSNPNHGQASATYELGLRMRGSSLFHGENKDVGNANRRNTCGSAKFTNLFPTIPEADSCDEFPFAGTQEGGTDGSLCAEITPTKVNGVWTTPPTHADKPVTDQPCIQSHMPLFNNKSAGSVYGNFKKDQRIIKGDAFWMTITP